MTDLADSFYVLLPGSPSPRQTVDRKNIVMLHGLLQDHSAWIGTAARLRDEFGHNVGGYIWTHFVKKKKVLQRARRYKVCCCYCCC